MNYYLGVGLVVHKNPTPHEQVGVGLNDPTLYNLAGALNPTVSLSLLTSRLFLVGKTFELGGVAR